MKVLLPLLCFFVISGPSGGYNIIVEKKSKFDRVNLSCQGPILSLIQSDENVARFTVTNAVEGYQETISLWDDSTFSYEVYGRVGARFSAGNYALNDSLLYLYSEYEYFQEIFKREKRRRKWKYYFLIELGKIFIKRDKEICFQRDI